MCQVSRSVSGNLPEGKIATCILVFDRSEALTHSRGNMCCLGRYKGVILLLGTSPPQKPFHFSFQPPQKPLFDLIFPSMTASNQSDSVYFHLENTFSVEGMAKDLSEEQGVLVWKGLRRVSLSHVNVLLQGLLGAKL